MLRANDQSFVSKCFRHRPSEAWGRSRQYFRNVVSENKKIFVVEIVNRTLNLNLILTQITNFFKNIPSCRNSHSSLFVSLWPVVQRVEQSVVYIFVVVEPTILWFFFGFVRMVSISSPDKLFRFLRPVCAFPSRLPVPVRAHRVLILIQGDIVQLLSTALYFFEDI